MNKLLSPGKKLKLLRKKYKITQQELTRNGLKRTTLSMIETEHNNLTQKTGALIAKNINEILAERGIDDRIDLEYLLESVENQIEQRLLQYIDELDEDDSNLNNILEEINYYKYQLKSSVVIFDISQKVGDVYFKKGKYFEALVSYTTIFDHLLNMYETRDTKVIFSSVFNCLASYYYLRKYKESLGFYKLVEKINHIFSPIEKFLLLKLRLATKMNLGQYRECLSSIEETRQTMKLDNMEELELKILEAECNLNMKNYFTAGELLDLIKKDDDPKLALYARVKEASMYADTNELKKLETFLDGLLEDLSQSGERNIYKTELYFDIALCLLKLNRFEEAEKYLKLSIDIFNSNNYVSLEMLIKLYLEREDKKSLVEVGKQIVEFVEHRYLEETDKIIFDLIYAFSKLNMAVEISILIDEMRSSS